MRYTLALLVTMAFLVAACTQTTTPVGDPETPVVVAPVEPQIKTLVVTGEDFAFFMDGQEAPEITVNVGDTVRIEFTSTQGFHDWVVDEFGAATEQVQMGDSTFVEFVADKAGTFEYYCSVGEHRANGMFGSLVVV